MPTYVYKCDECESVIEKFRLISKRNDVVECECGEEMGRVMFPTSKTHLIFKETMLERIERMDKRQKENYKRSIEGKEHI